MQRLRISMKIDAEKKIAAEQERKNKEAEAVVEE